MTHAYSEKGRPGFIMLMMMRPGLGGGEGGRWGRFALQTTTIHTHTLSIALNLGVAMTIHLYLCVCTWRTRSFTPSPLSNMGQNKWHSTGHWLTHPPTHTHLPATDRRRIFRPECGRNCGLAKKSLEGREKKTTKNLFPYDDFRSVRRK